MPDYTLKKCFLFSEHQQFSFYSGKEVITQIKDSGFEPYPALRCLSSLQHPGHGILHVLPGTDGEPHESP